MASKSLKFHFECRLCTVQMLNFKENDKASELHEEVGFHQDQRKYQNSDLVKLDKNACDQAFNLPTFKQKLQHIAVLFFNVDILILPNFI